MSESPTRCAYFPRCNACQYWHLEYGYQIKTKISELKSLLGQNGLSFSEPIDFISCGKSGLRDRIDFTFKMNSETGLPEFGFYDKDKNLLSINKCLQLSQELQEIYNEFKSIQPMFGSRYIKRGSVRLRSGLSGIKGCWLDLSNVDIKALLDDQTYLRELLNRGFVVEIGQKGKALADVGGKLKLTDPLPKPWFKTINQNGGEIPLYSLISDFTQPSRATAAALTKIVLNWVASDNSKPNSILEFGAGIGQFTASLLASQHSVTALEVDSSAYESLRLNTSGTNESKFKIFHDDFHRRSIQTDASVILVNPARSGLKSFVNSIIESKAARLVYISCFPESLCEDVAKLKDHYRIEDVKIVDQFPQTRHFESCVLLTRIK